MTKQHEGKVAVVTGAARSMGQEIAVFLASRGAKVASVDLLDSSDTERRVAEVGGDFLGIQADLTSESDVARVQAAVTNRFGGADILVNVAGILPSMPWDQTDYATFKRIQTVNLDSIFLMCKAFVPHMREKGWGRIINFSSGIVEMPVPNYVAYRTSKASILGFSRGLASDLGDDGITVNSVTPSFVVTPGTTEAGDADKEPFITQMQVIKRTAKPRDIVGLVSFLASDDADFITGQMMHADGGLVLR